MLKITNSLSKQKEIFQPHKAPQVQMYVCGNTVYDYSHIGHARTYVVFDMVARYLRELGYEVNYVRNITDIDDKIIKRAAENQEPVGALTARFIAAWKEDEARLMNHAPDQEPRATHYIAEMIAIIQQLIDRHYAYLIPGDGVYYEVSRFENYGQLAHQDMEKLRSGARIDILDAKRDPLDFALWKFAEPDEVGWDSPWGYGRPGWHIECSAMSRKTLSPHIDIHGGGIDLIFPHHQNELAQSEASAGAPFVKYWMHSGHVRVNEEKMSKSLNNFFTIREVLEKYHPEVVRYFLLASYYRSPINYSTENLDSAKNALMRFYLALLNLPAISSSHDSGKALPFSQAFYAAMNDDFNTPEALAALFEGVREINRLKQDNQLEKAAIYAAELKRLAGILGLLAQAPEDFLQIGQASIDTEEIERLMAARNQARLEKNWKEADRIRNYLLEKNILIEDHTDGTTTWRQKI